MTDASWPYNISEVDSMNCPVCDARLRAVEKYGVEVDICPDCKGVWLDRGELEKILEMAATSGPAQSMSEARPVERQSERRSDHYYENDKHHDHRDREQDHDSRTDKPRRKESWLGQIFESFGGGED